MNRSVTIVVPTIGDRLIQLRRAIHSIAQQTYQGPLDALIVTYSAPLTTYREIQAICQSATIECRPINIKAGQIPRDPSSRKQLDLYSIARVGHQRNYAAELATGELVGFLDDDNEYLASHVETLVDALARRPAVRLAHSWRYLLWEDGTPYKEDLYPWIKRPIAEHSRYIYDELVSLGVFRRGSPEVRDRMTSNDGIPLLTVDTSEWLIERSFLLQHPFREKYTFREISHGLAEDYVFARMIFDLDVEVACSESFTVNYYLGGGSTRWIRNIS